MSLFLIWFWGFTLKAAIASQGFFHSCITCSLLKFPAELVTEDVHNRHVDKSVDVGFFTCFLQAFILPSSGAYVLRFVGRRSRVCAVMHIFMQPVLLLNDQVATCWCLNVVIYTTHLIFLMLASDTNEKHFCFGDLSGPIMLFLIFCHI